MWRNWHPENWGTQGEVFAFLLHTSIDPSAKISLMIQLLISQMKELGVIVYNCSCLVLDLQRIFALYSSLRYKNKIPPSWSKRLYGVYDTQNKLTLQLNETKSEAFVSVSSEMSSRVGGKGRNLLNPQDIGRLGNLTNHNFFFFIPISGTCSLPGLKMLLDFIWALFNFPFSVMFNTFPLMFRKQYRDPSNQILLLTLIGRTWMSWE